MEKKSEENIKLRVWWIRNPPNEANYHDVKSIEDAFICLQRLMDRDLHNDTISSNSGGLEVFENNEWTEWYDAGGRDAMQIIQEKGEL